MSYIYSIIYVIILIIFFRYLKKKFSIYKKIFKVDGLDGLYYYFKNKNFKNTKINNFIDKKKYNLGLKIKKKAKTTKIEITKDVAEKILKEENENKIKEKTKLVKEDED